jgi:hypothetical protein
VSKNLALAGIIAPILFIVIVIVLGVIDSDLIFVGCYQRASASGADYAHHECRRICGGELVYPPALGLHQASTAATGRDLRGMLGISGIVGRMDCSPPT